MMRIISGVFIVLHGLVHLLYFGQSRRLFELQPGMTWPDGSWIFSRILGEQATRWLADAWCVVAALGFVAGGVGGLAGQSWWRPTVMGSAAFSATMVILFWDGTTQKLADQGAIALLINLALLAVLLMWKGH